MRISVKAVSGYYLEDLRIPEELSRYLRRADTFIQLAVVAAFQTFLVADEGVQDTHDDCGLILGTTFGTMETNFEVLDQIVTGQQASPILFSHSVFNAAVGYMATVFKIRGCALTVTDFSFPFFRALQEASLALYSGAVTRCLVLQVETYSTLLQDARKTHGVDTSPWIPGVVCWLLEAETKENSSHFCLDRLEIDAGVSDPLEFLRYHERVDFPGRTENTHSPMGAAMIIGEEIGRENKQGLLDCRIEGVSGSVRIQLTKG